MIAGLIAVQPASAQTIPTVGSACTSAQATFWEQSGICPASTGVWQRPAFQFGPAVASCASGTAGMMQWTGSALQYCNGTSWVPFFNNYDVAIFVPSTPGASYAVHVVLPRAATYPSSLTGSSCYAAAAATGSTTITIKQIHNGTATSVGTAVFAAAAKTCTFTAASTITTAAGDSLQFVFPATQDATLANVGITLQGVLQ